MGIWPFRRRRDTEPDSGSDSGSDSAPASVPTVSAAKPSPPRPPRPSGEWNRLPVLTRTSGPPPLVAPLSRIAEGMSSNAESTMVLAPLGHQRRHDAPTGVVSGTITPKPVTATGGQVAGPPLELPRIPVPPSSAEPDRADTRAGDKVAVGVCRRMSRSEPCPASPPCRSSRLHWSAIRRCRLSGGSPPAVSVGRRATSSRRP